MKVYDLWTRKGKAKTTLQIIYDQYGWSWDEDFVRGGVKEELVYSGQDLA